MSTATIMVAPDPDSLSAYESDHKAENNPSRKPPGKSLKTRQEKMPEDVREWVLGMADRMYLLSRSERVRRYGTPQIDECIVAEARRQRIAWFRGMSDADAEEHVDFAGWSARDNSRRGFHALKSWMQSGIAEAVRLERGAHLEAEIA
jgi:hypothetical protein